MFFGTTHCQRYSDQNGQEMKLAKCKKSLFFYGFLFKQIKNLTNL